MPIFEACQTRLASQFLKHAKHAIFWSTPSTPYYEAYQVYKAREHDKYSST